MGIELVLNVYYYACKDIYKEYEKEDIKPHFNYKNLESELRYTILLFNRSVNWVYVYMKILLTIYQFLQSGQTYLFSFSAYSYVSPTHFKWHHY